MTGTEIRIVLTSSRNVPSRKYSIITARMTISGDRPHAVTQPTSAVGNCVRTMNRAKMNAPITMKNSIAVAYAVSRKAPSRPRQRMWPVANAITIAAKALTAAASVGEYQPR